MSLKKEQHDALIALVEAERAVPKSQRQAFLISLEYSTNPPGAILIHPGWDSSRSVFEGDLQELRRAGLIGYMKHDSFYVTSDGLDYYEQLMAGSSSPLEQVEERTLSYISGTWFKSKYPEAFSKWAEAETLLWSRNEELGASQVGHLCRESLQAFVHTLASQYDLADEYPDKAKTGDRLRAVLNKARPEVGPSAKRFLLALVSYFGCLSDLVQRQEHGGNREQEELTLLDSRRVVFHLAGMFAELDHLLGRR